MARILLAAFVALLLVVGPCHARPAPQHAAKSAAKGKAVVDGITAIYNFGDSLSDTGNLLREGAGGMLQYTTAPPYGSAIGGTTGRCSDGLVVLFATSCIIVFDHESFVVLLIAEYCSGEAVACWRDILRILFSRTKTSPLLFCVPFEARTS
ncbi:hypothetical protein C2845_PM12G19670 [Panicum miliaceum]|uniref:GDSL esterase/lipase n=1 Tax=Panicum miliaceum TaxID=4540 RepID=A0A3L6QJF3_PANMI|nr:hypothetical protein C2845_PM12G19670 [Panicum miliaceum]